MSYPVYTANPSHYPNLSQQVEGWEATVEGQKSTEVTESQIDKFNAYLGVADNIKKFLHYNTKDMQVLTFFFPSKHPRGR